jgi:hypothetical protein
MALRHILVLDSTGFNRVAVKTSGMNATAIFTIFCFLVNFLTFVESFLMG